MDPQKWSPVAQSHQSGRRLGVRVFTLRGGRWPAASARLRLGTSTRPDPSQPSLGEQRFELLIQQLLGAAQAQTRGFLLEHLARAFVQPPGDLVAALALLATRLLGN